MIERRRTIAGSRRWHDTRPTRTDRVCEAIVALSLLLLGIACLLAARS